MRWRSVRAKVSVDPGPYRLSYSISPNNVLVGALTRFDGLLKSPEVGKSGSPEEKPSATLRQAG